MSNYKWVQMSEGFVELRNEDFSSISFLKVDLSNMNQLILEKLRENGVDDEIVGDGFFETPQYVLTALKPKFVEIKAPLYEFDLDSGKYELLSDSYTDMAVDPAQYEWVKETYLRCTEEVAKEQAQIFEKEFAENSIDDGISSVIAICSDNSRETPCFYEQYVPKNYIKVCEKRSIFLPCLYDAVFIKQIDAKGKTVTMKVLDLYKGRVIGKNKKNIKRVAKMINAKWIEVI